MATNPPIRTINISLPEPMREFVEDEVARGSYSSASEYFRELLRRAQREQVEERLEVLLLEGLETGAGSELAPGEFQALRRSVRAQGIEELRQKLAQGAAELDRGESRPLDLAELKAEGRRRLEDRREP